MQTFSLSLAALPLIANAVHGLAIPSSPNAYAPVPTTCPTTNLVRPATGLNTEEAEYRQDRKAIADEALRKWLAETGAGFEYGDAELPTIGLTTSGGGYRSLLVGAGVIQGLDGRDSNVSTSGLYQALTYQSGLSGGAWLLASFAGNNYPTITELSDTLWEEAFQNGLITPDGVGALDVYNEIVDDAAAKAAAGFDPTLTDPYGRLLSQQLFNAPLHGANITLSSVAGLSNFTARAVPYPVILALGVKTFDGECLPEPNGTIYEFTPFEFGSWDSDVSAFTPTTYLGTSLSNGQPANAGECVTNYDNLGYVLGTSSNLFNEVCISVPEDSLLTDLLSSVEETLDKVHAAVTRDQYAVYPNPFYQYNSSTMLANMANPVQAQKELSLVDGGEALQNNPIWPMLQPARGVDVLLVNDNSADTSSNFPNGSEILTTYVQTFNHNLARMPFIPSVETFISQGLNKRATFFGCSDTDKITIVYLPNNNITYASNESTAKLQYSTNETEKMIENGVAVATQGDDEDWGTCLGCAIMAKTKTQLPAKCDTCLEKYCYEP